MTTYVIDTCAFNKMVDGLFDVSSLPADSEFVISHIQIDEVNNTTDANKERRAMLLIVMAKLRPTVVPTESMIWDTSRWDNAKFSDGVSYNALKSALDGLNKNKKNNHMDALIAEVAIKNSWTLLTADRHLAQVTENLGCAVKLI
jgi:predicted nucleic acid-binding protein